MRIQRWSWAIAVAVGVLFASSSLEAQSGEQLFYRAYFLENEAGEVEQAEQLYRRVANDSSVSGELREQARRRAAACREERMSADLASLMIPNTLAYIEIREPARYLAEVVDMLGLLREPGSLEERVGISETLLQEMLGIRGLAAGITGFDPVNQRPIGALVMHPGRVDAVQGIIETALPVASKRVDPIGGFPTFHIENEVFVTLTSKLVVASTQRMAIDSVIRRLRGDETNSFANSTSAGATLKSRPGAVISFCVNFKGVLPLIEPMLQAAVSREPEAALALKLFDPSSLDHLVGAVQVSEDGRGVGLDLSLYLDEGHRNLFFNFMRVPGVDRNVLKLIPQGAAGFATAALNPSGDQRISLTVGDESSSTPPVTWLDLGREIFGNIRGVAAYVLPTSGEIIGGQEVPGAALVMTCHDATKSEAIWTQFLGIASMGAGTGTFEGRTESMGGTDVHAYRMPEGVTVFVARAGDSLVISPSKTAVTRSLDTRQGQPSVLEDPMFARALSKVTSATTWAACVSPLRCLQIGQKFMSPREREEIAPFMPLLEQSMVGVMAEHSDNHLRLRAGILGIPEVGPMVSDLVMRELGSRSHHAAAARERALVAQHKAREQAIEQARHRSQSPNPDALWKSLPQQQDPSKARQLLNSLGTMIREDARRLNDYAWALLTEDHFGGKYNEIALRWSKRSNELQPNNWAYVDTLARAHFAHGHLDQAIALQRKALELVGQDSRRGEVEASLKEYLAARKKI